MTTSRSRRFEIRDVSYHEVAASEPDSIGIEVRAGELGSIVFDVMKERAGRSSICFGSVEPGEPAWELDLTEFRQMLDQALQQVDAWEADLRGRGKIWSD